MDIASGLELEIIEADSREVGRNWDYQEFNPFAKLYYIIDGEGEITISGRKVLLQAGRLYFIPPYMPLVLSCEGRMVHHWAHFTMSTLHGGLLCDLIGDRNCVCPDDSDRDEVIRYFKLLGKHYKAPNARSRLAAQGYLRILLSLMLPDDQSFPEGFEQFDRTLEYIEDNLSGDLDNRTLAKLHGWHPTYFANCFSRVLGMSPRAYIIRRRVEEARKLLWSGEYTVEQAGLEVGFSDVYYFSKVFRRLSGITPGRYRREARQGH